MAHTPGPWEVFPDEWTGRRTAVVVSPATHAAVAWIGETDCIGTDEPSADYEDLTEEDWANAQLIIAAPNLLERLKSLVMAVVEEYAGLSTDLELELEAARAAITKAEGR